MSSAAPNPHVADAIARAERRRGKLERMSDIGMQLVEQVGAHAAAAGAAINEEATGNPARAFATLSRAVRLTLAMEARIDRQILALRNGQASTAEGGGGLSRDDARQRARVAVAAPEDDDERRARGELCENLTDRESFGRFLDLAPRGARSAPADEHRAAPDEAALDELGLAGRWRAPTSGSSDARALAARSDLSRPPTLERRLE